MNPKIAKVVVDLPVDGPFDYLIPKDMQKDITVGQRVRILFNRRSCIGVVVDFAQRSAFKRLNPVLELLDGGPVLDESTLTFIQAFAEYYGCSLGEGIAAYLPTALRRGKLQAEFLKPAASSRKKSPKEPKIILIHDQASGEKWKFIAERIQKIIKRKGNVLVLIPDIFFLKDTVSALSKLIEGPIEALDKHLTPKKELERWETVRRSEGIVLIGTRSAIFAPLTQLELIVVDEEANDSYKQEQTPHYHAREIAEMRAASEQCDLIFTGSVPSAEIWEKARRRKWQKVSFKTDRPSSLQVVDMTNYNPGKTSILSFPSQNAMRKTLDEGGRVVLFMNRKGFNTKTHCQQCGFTVKCERCNVHLTYLYAKKVMVCRHCNFTCELPKICPECKGSYMRSTGTGIEKLESDVARLYPGVSIQHFDRNSKSFPANADVIIATSAIFRRHGAWRASLIAILNFDAQMHRFDFRSGEKAFSLLIHLSLLADQKLIVQTRMPDNYCIKAAAKRDFNLFYREELKQRKELDLPPYRHLVAVVLRGKDEEKVFNQSQELYELLSAKQKTTIEISDPHPDVNPKLRDKYRYTILLKGRSVKGILTLVKKTLKSFRKKSTIITINVDP